MNKYIWGLDLSISCTGVAIFDSDNPAYINNIPTKSKDSHGLRLKQIYDELDRLKKIYNPSVICIERGFYRFNKSSEVVWKVHGIVNLLFYDFDIIYYSPREVKRAVLSGNSSKDDVQKQLKIWYPEVVFKDDNESDAFAVALTYLKQNNV